MSTFIVPLSLEKGILLSCAVILLGTILLASWIRRRSATKKNSIGFVHPPAFYGGGGERVLWLAIEAIMKEDKKRNVSREYVLYCHDEFKVKNREKEHEIHSKIVESQFGVKILTPLRYVYLPKIVSTFLNGDSYPVAALVFQTIIGNFILFYYCAIVNKAQPIMVETVGNPFLYPLCRVFCNSTVITYVHFPLVSSDMAASVKQKEATRTNREMFRKNVFLRYGKLCYYYLFMVFYCFLGQFPAVVFTNSTWTDNHMKKLFWPRKTEVLYPPCPVQRTISGGKQSESTQPLNSSPASSRRNRIIAIGQFRPEKNHCFQMRAFCMAVPDLPSDATLAFYGGCRNEGGYNRLENYKAFAKELNIAERVEFHVNEPFEVLQKELRTSLIGLHAMKDEHFGIVNVEYMAAGCITLAHRSGGVLSDIVTSPKLGMLAATEKEYAEAMKEIFRKKKESPEALDLIQKAASEHALLFDDSAFQARFIARLKDLLWNQTDKYHVMELEDSFASLGMFPKSKQ